MAKGQTYNHERIAYTDARTGASVLQLTSFPVINFCLVYFCSNFTPDSRTLIFLSQRGAWRDAPFDLFRVDVDGANLTQLTDSDGIGGFAYAPDGKSVYFQRGNALWRLDPNTFHEEEIVRCEAAQMGGMGHTTPDGRYYFTLAPTGRDTSVLIRYATDGTEAAILREWEGGWTNLHSCAPGGTGLLSIRHVPGGKEYHLMDYEGRDLGLYSKTWDFAHCTFLGRTAQVQGCALPPDHAVCRIGVSEETPTPLAQGLYFWHSASTLDGEWIVADTNWPDCGLQLIHVPSGRYHTLCYPQSSQGHPQWTHPHPQFSPDGNYVLYNSDRTGICQVYLARVPEELREQLRTGQLTAKDRLLP